MKSTSSLETHFSLELLAMIAVIAISSWHIGNYMATFDGWLMACIMGATLGFCNFLCAHNIFKTGSTSRLPSFVGLVFFAVTSTWMQYTYFNQDPNIGATIVKGINLDALALGVWAPAAEILLGWIYAAGSRQHSPTPSSPGMFWSRLDRLTAVATHRLEQRLAGAHEVGTNEQSLPAPSKGYILQQQADSTADTKEVDSPRRHLTSSGPLPNAAESAKPSKEDALQMLLELFEHNPHTTYEQAGHAIGRSKATISNYVQELKETKQIEVTDDHGIVVLAHNSTADSL